MVSRILCACVAVCAVAVGLGMVQSALGVDDLFNGSGSGAAANWNTDANWQYSDSSGSFIPDAQFGDYAVLGTTNTLGKLNANVTLATTPPNVGGIIMGREATSTGTLTISAGTLNVVPETGLDANALGTVVVGSGGRGYLTMTGGSLVTRGLTVGGENLTTGSGLSSVNLSGAATVTVSGGGGNVTFNQNLTITGPNVNFSDTGNIRLNSTNTYNAVITSATAHSPIKATGNLILGGNLNVSFSGLATNPAVGQTWNLFDYGAGLGGGFANATFGADVAVSGLPQPVPLGAAFRLKKATGGTNGKLIQLVQDRILVLQVNRDTGELRVTNPQGGAINMDSYLITSYTAGSLKSTYKGISALPPGIPGGRSRLPTAGPISPRSNRLALSMFRASARSGITLGTGFDKFAVDNNVGMSLGTNGEDLAFYYGDPASSQQIKGQVQYIGTKFENNLVLSINSSTAQRRSKTTRCIP